MSGRLVLMGSGETTATMVTPHQRVLRASGEGQRLFLDTPYGFQENADELGERIRDYFAHNVGVAVAAASLREASDASAARVEQVRVALRDAAWVFAGPGSPSYVLGQWQATGIDRVLRERVAAGRTVVLASAAACVAGTRTIPVYEVYKAGFTPWWLDGIDLVGMLGLRAVVVPHWDNAEGGTHDTSKCWLGERRLRLLEAELDEDEWVLGIDEHTAVEVDLAEGGVTVSGRGGMTVRVRGRERRWEAGAACSVAEVRAAAAALGAAAPSTAASDAVVEDPGPDATDATDPRDRFAAAVGAGDVAGALDVVLEVEAAVAAGDGDRALLRELVARLAGLARRGVADPREVVAPHVETLLHVRDRLRDRRDFDEADHIRGHLTAGGVEVRDTPEGAQWDLAADQSVDEP